VLVKYFRGSFAYRVRLVPQLCVDEMQNEVESINRTCLSIPYGAQDDAMRMEAEMDEI
jgi:hypothetical protein